MGYTKNMEYASIYRRFRPTTFDKVIGQKHVVRTLTNQIKSGNIGHAYLFTGTRGTGKTSCAKIFARAVNCLTPVNGSPCGKCANCLALESGTIDIVEMDAASNNGVDEIRQLRENAMFLPTMGKYKVYIIDEVHMLTGSAFNALLKTLEEPPKHVVFILATTEVQKLPQTILSRCIRFDFRLVEVEELVNLLKDVFTELKVGYDERALTKIAIQGEGSVRDTLSIADTCMSYCNGNVTYEDTLDILCATDFSTLDRLATAILDGDVGNALTLSEQLQKSGRNNVARELASYYNSLIAVKNVPNCKLSSITDNERKILKARAGDYTNYKISRAMEIMASLENQLRFASQPRILFEANVVKACNLTTEVNVDGVINRVKELEHELDLLKSEGVKVSSVKTVVVEEAPAQPAPVVNKATDLLKKMGLKEETDVDKLVFKQEEVPVDSESVGRAMEIWERVKQKLEASSEMALKIICETIDSGVTLRDKEFILRCNDDATYEMLIDNYRRNVLANFIKEVSGIDYVFTCLPPEKKGMNPESKVKIMEAFNGQVKFKK